MLCKIVTNFFAEGLILVRLIGAESRNDYKVHVEILVPLNSEHVFVWVGA